MDTMIHLAFPFCSQKSAHWVALFFYPPRLHAQSSPAVEAFPATARGILSAAMPPQLAFLATARAVAVVNQLGDFAAPRSKSNSAPHAGHSHSRPLGGSQPFFQPQTGHKRLHG
ncbi:hypothetical protein EM20IM_03260 [Candidatus Methylacidiphilum infernorum]|uniref:Uncharacterized protein n=1 Tax=Candidatus Methylacidiphilum infernorum TaxID=511746 RepID=A0ABX7PXI0_9BACT|nr:hypothetical protein [Candidatus Methylacidiphilum infernorum]QSR87361.1 hypothetical protein EM20IM_03260 [Candidatus Methylacidiphilum infernorum]